MDFKMNTVVSTLLLMYVMFAITAHCNYIAPPDYVDEDGDKTYYYGVPVYSPSRECSMLGGLCVQENDCARDQLTQKTGLCQDRENGVECCYQVTPREAPCQQFGGACMDTCALPLRQSLANDCGPTQMCCILVNRK